MTETRNDGACCEVNPSRKALHGCSQCRDPLAIAEARVSELEAENAQIQRHRLADEKVWLEQSALASQEWAAEYDRAHRAESNADRLAAMGRALQTQLDEQRIRIAELSARLTRVTQAAEEAIAVAIEHSNDAGQVRAKSVCDILATALADGEADD